MFRTFTLLRVAFILYRFSAYALHKIQLKNLQIAIAQNFRKTTMETGTEALFKQQPPWRKITAKTFHFLRRAVHSYLTSPVRRENFFVFLFILKITWCRSFRLFFQVTLRLNICYTAVLWGPTNWLQRISPSFILAATLCISLCLFRSGSYVTKKRAAKKSDPHGRKAKSTLISVWRWPWFKKQKTKNYLWNNQDYWVNTLDAINKYFYILT